MISSINLDITHRCRLQCSKCMRSEHPGLYKRGHDISLENMQKIADVIPSLGFCGQMGDPIYHPQFDKIMEICRDNIVQVSTNGSGKSLEWWKNIHSINPYIKWIFGLDGLPKDSHKYRVNQDGEQVFEVMKYLAKLSNSIHWQYIVFRYNENDMEEATQLAKDNNIKLNFVYSSRWNDNDELKPINPKYYRTRPKMS